MRCYFCHEPIVMSHRSFTGYTHEPNHPNLPDGDTVCDGLPEGQRGYAIPEGTDLTAVNVCVWDEELTLAELCGRAPVPLNARSGA